MILDKNQNFDLEKNKNIGIIIPCYREANNVGPLYDALIEALRNESNYKFQFIFIDDGSPDNLQEKIGVLRSRDSRVHLISLSRNFGKEAAMTAGLHCVEADAYILMDADLQHPPAIIPEFLRKWENGYEVVATQRTYSYRRSLVRSVGAYIFYRIMSLSSDLDLITQSTDFRLVDRKIVDTIRKMPERGRLVRGLIDWLGFRRAIIQFEVPKRFSGEAQLGFRQLVRLAINSFTSFSLLPLRLAGYLGIFVSTISILVLFIMLMDRLFLNRFSFSNLAFVAITNSFLFGVVLLCLGLIALYIGNIHVEIQNRPVFVVRSTTLDHPLS